MAQKDEILSILQILKILIISCLIGLFLVLSYTVIKYKTLNIVQIISIEVGGVLLFSAIFILLNLYLNKSRRLRDL